MDSNESPIESARKAAGQSILGLSNKTGIPRTTLTRKLEHPSTFTLAEVAALAAALNADATQWVSELVAAA